MMRARFQMYRIFNGISKKILEMKSHFIFSTDYNRQSTVLQRAARSRSRCRADRERCGAARNAKLRGAARCKLLRAARRSVRRAARSTIDVAKDARAVSVAAAGIEVRVPA